jgi:hypothetical protein
MVNNNYMKKYSESWAIHEMQVNRTLRFHLPTVRVAIIKNRNNKKYWQGCRKKSPYLYSVGGNVN